MRPPWAAAHFQEMETWERRFEFAALHLLQLSGLGSFSASIHLLNPVYQRILCLTVARAQQWATKERPDRSRAIEMSFSSRLLQFRNYPACADFQGKPPNALWLNPWSDIIPPDVAATGSGSQAVSIWAPN
jgi:hypothetical protein